MNITHTMKNWLSAVGLVCGLFLIHYILAIFITYFLPTLQWNNLQPTKNFIAPAFYTQQPVVTDPAYLLRKWDSNFYLNIAEYGYQINPHNQSTFLSLSFYPLYPLITGAIPSLIGASNNLPFVYYLGLLFSNIFLVVTVVYLKKLMEFFSFSFTKQFAFFALLFAFPASYFLQLFYTESLFLMLSVLCFYTLFQKKFLLSALCLSLLLVTRPYGVTLILPFFAYFVYASRHMHIAKRMGTFLLSVILIIIPFGAYNLYVIQQTGDIMGYAHVEQLFDKQGFLPFAFFVHYASIIGLSLRIEYVLSLLLILGLVCEMVWVGIKLLRQRHTVQFAEYGTLFLYGIIYLFLVCSLTSFDSIFRFISVNVAFLLLPIGFIQLNPHKYTFWLTILLLILFFFILFHGIFFINFLLQIPAYGF